MNLRGSCTLSLFFGFQASLVFGTKVTIELETTQGYDKPVFIT